MRATLRSRISRTLIAGIALLSLLVMLCATAVQFYRDYQAGLTDLRESLEQARQIADSSLSLAVWTENDTQIQFVLDGLIKIPGLYYAEVVERGQVRARAGEPPARYPIEFETPLRFAPASEAPTEIARLRIVAGEDAIRDQLTRRLQQRLSATVAEIVALALFVVLFLSRYLTRHLRAIALYLGALEFEHNRAIYGWTALRRCLGVRTNSTSSSPTSTRPGASWPDSTPASAPAPKRPAGIWTTHSPT